MADPVKANAHLHYALSAVSSLQDDLQRLQPEPGADPAELLAKLRGAVATHSEQARQAITRAMKHTS